MPTDYEDEHEDNNDEPEETFADKYGFENLNIQIPNVSPEEEREIRARLRCGWNMSGEREAVLNAVAEKWLDHYLTSYEDAVIPRAKEKMLRLLTEVIIPACQIFGLHDDADLEQKVTPDDTAIELIIESVGDFFYGDDHGIRVSPL